MPDVTQPIPSQLAPVIDRYRRWSPEWWPWIKALLTQLKTTVADVDSVVETVDQVRGKWGVDITEDGRVRAAVRLDASETTSNFVVISDRFLVTNPAGSSEIEAFVDGFVDSQPSVGLNGLFVVDGTILARHLSVGTLSAISADIGTVTAGVIRSDDGRMVIDLNAPSITMTA